MWEKVNSISIKTSNNTSTATEENTFLKKTLKKSSFNIICVSALLSAIDYIFAEVRPLNLQQLPNLAEVLW